MSCSLLRGTSRTAVLIFLLAVVVRALLFGSVLSDLRHGSARLYGSAAIGLVSGEGLTYHEAELRAIARVSDNLSQDYLDFHESAGRRPLVEFLPGPAVLLGALWRVVPVHNFAPYLLLQILLDSILIALLYATLSRFDRLLALLTALIMTVNIATIKRTLMMGYDFWPQFGVLATFIGAHWVLGRRKGAGWYALVGSLGALPLWFRDITLLLPFFLVPCLALLLRSRGEAWRSIMRRTAAFIAPVLVCIALISAYRYEVTGSPRPTRSTFWHSFFAGVGQFPNPYGIDHTDESVWELGKRLNSKLEGYDVREMIEEGQRPDSVYELTLRQEARQFIARHRGMFARNWLYRIGIMISPILYTGGDLVPRRLSDILRPVGFLMLPLWLVGMFVLWRRDNTIFWLSAATYIHFFVVFGWFYVVGRVILPFMFVSILVTLAGLSYLLGRVPRWTSSRR